MNTQAGVSKGHLIDEHCNTSGTLIEDETGVYSCTLNQTNLKANANKFYIMQLIKDGSMYVHFIRYGRIGEVGRISHNKYTALNEAKASFAKQFKTKTKNKWEDRGDFVKYNGKYFLTEVSYEDELKDVSDDVKSVPDSELNKKVQDLLSLLSDVNMMRNTLVQLDIDTKKMPLGKIKKTQIDKAKELLSDVQVKIQELKDAKIVNNTKVDDIVDEIMDLSSEYYTYIPYACGRKKPPVINTDELLSKFSAILDDLENIVVGVQIVEGSNNGDKNPLDAIYDEINTEIKPLKKNTKIYKELVKYVANTHGPTHSCKLEGLYIYDIEQKGKREAIEQYVT